MDYETADKKREKRVQDTTRDAPLVREVCVEGVGYGGQGGMRRYHQCSGLLVWTSRQGGRPGSRIKVVDGEG